MLEKGLPDPAHWVNLLVAVGTQGRLVILMSLPQHSALPCVCGLPNDHPEGPREAGWLAPHLHYLHPEWHYRQPGQRHLPPLPGRGTNLGDKGRMGGMSPSFWI